MKTPDRFFENFTRFSELARLIGRNGESFAYEFMDVAEFAQLGHSENAAGRGPAKINQIYAREILFRAHWAAITAVWRSYRWMQGMELAMKHPNYFVFCASLRGLLESAADTNDALFRSVSGLANNFATLRHSFAGKFDHGLMTISELEDLLIHYAYARRLPKGTNAPVSHSAKSAQNYLAAFEEANSREVRDLYAELCEITHPAAATVHFFVRADDSVPSQITIREPVEMDFILSLLSRHDAVFAPLFQKSFNSALISLHILNQFGETQFFTSGAQGLDFSKVVAFNGIERAMKESVVVGL